MENENIGYIHHSHVKLFGITFKGCIIVVLFFLITIQTWDCYTHARFNWQSDHLPASRGNDMTILYERCASDARWELKGSFYKAEIMGAFGEGRFFELSYSATRW